MGNATIKNVVNTIGSADFDDVPEITDFSGFKQSPRIAKIAAKAKVAGRYYTRVFNNEQGMVEIKEIDSTTHTVISTKIVAFNEVL